MSEPISIRLDDDDRAVFSLAAERAGVGLATLIRRILHERARELRIEQIRLQSRAVGQRARADSRIGEYYEEIGAPRARV